MASIPLENRSERERKYISPLFFFSKRARLEILNRRLTTTIDVSHAHWIVTQRRKVHHLVRVMMDSCVSTPHCWTRRVSVNVWSSPSTGSSMLRSNNSRKSDGAAKCHRRRYWSGIREDLLETINGGHRWYCLSYWMSSFNWRPYCTLRNLHNLSA